MSESRDASIRRRYPISVRVSLDTVRAADAERRARKLPSLSAMLRPVIEGHFSEKRRKSAGRQP